jgi:hypothetical protein
MNVMALKTEYDWRVQRPEKKFDYRMPQASWWTPLELTPLATPPPPPPAEHLASTSPQVFHEALLASPHRTALAAEADYFYVPTWDFHGSWGNPEVRDRTHRRATCPSHSPYSRRRPTP